MKELNPQIKGTYFLCLFLPSSYFITIGKLGNFCFKKGFYLYTGKAFGYGGLYARIKRHIKKNTIKRWHIDYLKEKSIIQYFGIIANKDIECKIAQILLKKFSPVKRFGCSDCKCISHLFYSEDREEFIKCIKKAGISPALFYINWYFFRFCFLFLWYLYC